jgi:hypothetical protein
MVTKKPNAPAPLPLYPADSRLDGRRIQSRPSRDEKDLLALPGIESRKACELCKLPGPWVPGDPVPPGTGILLCRVLGPDVGDGIVLSYRLYHRAVRRQANVSEQHTDSIFRV